MSNTGSACAITRARGSRQSPDNNADRTGIWSHPKYKFGTIQIEIQVAALGYSKHWREPVGHFRIHFSLYFKASLSAKTVKK